MRVKWILTVAVLAATAGAVVEMAHPQSVDAQTGYTCGMFCIGGECEYGQPDFSCYRQSPVACYTAPCPI